MADVGCTNKYIPDNGNFIFVSEKNPVADPTISQFKANIVTDLGTAPFGHEVRNLKSVGNKVDYLKCKIYFTKFTTIEYAFKLSEGDDLQFIYNILQSIPSTNPAGK